MAEHWAFRTCAVEKLPNREYHRHRSHGQQTTVRIFLSENNVYRNTNRKVYSTRTHLQMAIQNVYNGNKNINKSTLE